MFQPFTKTLRNTVEPFPLKPLKLDHWNLWRKLVWLERGTENDARHCEWLWWRQREERERERERGVGVMGGRR